MTLRTVIAAHAAAILMAMPAFAQEDAAQDGAPQEPVVYIGAEHGDWQLRCIQSEEGPDPCRLYQAMFDDQGNKVSEITLFNLEEGGEAVAGALVATPLESLLTAGIRIKVDDGTQKSYPFRYCTHDGCFGQIGLTQADLDAFRAGSAATVSIVPLANTDVVVNVAMSLKGFTAGYQALMEQNAPR